MEDKIIHKELSYQVVGVLFEVFETLGYGYKESYYQKAIERGLKIKNIPFKSQVPFKLAYKGQIIGRIFLDFLIDNKIVLEIKKGNYFGRKNIEQILNYLKMTGLKLAILANFTPNGVKFLRILNSDKFNKPQEYKITITKKLFRL
jgi:GxxExxY protein